jgi:diguanylate cyclase (GGDEF)-like protein
MIFTAILLSWTSASRVPSFWLLCLAVVSMLVGDVGYAWIGTRGQTVGSPLLDLPFVIAFSLFGAAALHPSMRQLSAIQIRPVQAWSGERLMLLATMLLVPPIIVVQSGADADWIASVAGVVCTMLLLVRAVTAVHDHARAQERLRVQAAHDPLTGLPNRWGLVELVDGLLERAELSSDDEVDLLFLDLDSFKFVNDTWGHAAGDAVLVEFARRVRGEIREVDLAFRRGGEEFVVLLPETDARGAAIVAERLGAATRETPVPVESGGGARIRVTVSVGIAVYPDHASTGQQVLDAADDALYAAKAAGRDTWRLAEARPWPPVEELAVPAGSVSPADGLPRAGGASSGPHPSQHGVGR